MLLAARVLTGLAPEEVQQRAIARYIYMYADAFLLWGRRWRKQIARDPATTKQGPKANQHLRELAGALDAATGVRDLLAAKRHPAGSWRADDVEATARLWEAINPITADAITATSVAAYDALNASSPRSGSIAAVIGLPAEISVAVTDGLPLRDRAHWYLAADTSADQRPFTLAAAQGGELGRIIAQINDVAMHLDILLRIAPTVENVLTYDWLVKSALAVELNALLDLTVGPPPGGRYNVMFPLIELCRRGRPKHVAGELRRLRDSIGTEGWLLIRWMRDKLGAHLDNDLTMTTIHGHLIELDYRGVVRLAEHVLDFLDALGATQLDLALLLIGERKITSWSTDPTKAAPGAPDPHGSPGVMAAFFRRFDSPYMTMTASTLGSAVVAGITNGRKATAREPVTVLGRPTWRDIPAHIRLESTWQA
jgi:hypothetical protein